MFPEARDHPMAFQSISAIFCDVISGIVLMGLSPVQKDETQIRCSPGNTCYHKIKSRHGKGYKLIRK